MKKTSNISAFSTLKAFNVTLVNYLKTKCNIGCPVKLIFVKKERAIFPKSEKIISSISVCGLEKKGGKIKS